MLILRPAAASSGGTFVFRGARTWVDLGLFAALCALFGLTFVIRPFEIPSSSMSPTLERGDVVFVNLLAYRWTQPADGDVAIFHPPFPSKVDFVKRVVAVAGQRVAVRGGRLYVDGRPEPQMPGGPIGYRLRLARYGIQVDDGDGWVPLDPHDAEIPPKRAWQSPETVPKGYLFVMGDNRNDSDDSHVWGFVPRGSFAGRVFAVVWPVRRLHIIR